MTVIVVFGGIMIVAFLASFFSGRRFGVMALSLAVGSLLASWWGRLVADQLHSLGITIAGLPQTIFATWQCVSINIFLLYQKVRLV